MMELKDYIEIGVEKAGTQIELAKRIGILDVNLRMAKAGKRGLPVDVCILLADYVKVDRLEVIAASNLVTEKDERRRRIFESCFKKSNSAAASITMALLVTIILTLAPTKHADAGCQIPVNDTLYIMHN
ncbi:MULTISPECIES: hypothetical protein [Nitrosomonas]|uniref:Uncharacterized protein n=1 Tax=Nitrosomonas communis TaxID=44574 RepID=A0A0F7KH67_9PROT|nr:MULTISPECIES: hypothetical protein [Nitrosomonas]AKH38189.1 hypothetical protein AAW31_10920 [Nitrosomonas communis]TYP91128.1 hypothetical protein BCL69_101133 [Nitrosomonas communis]UVS60152.1 hypothetical protein NX761_11535 [Nitrosomonas sp. PLL12]